MDRPQSGLSQVGGLSRQRWRGDRPAGRSWRRRPGAWVRTFWLWDVYFAVVLASVVVSLVVDQDTATVRRLLATVVLTAMVALYAAAGRGLIRTGTQDWRSVTFIAAMIGLFTAAVVSAPSVGFLLFALCPLAFLVTPVGPAVVLVVVANVISPVAALVRDGFSTHLLAHLAPISAVTIALSVWLGIWIDQVVRQSQERADLIQQLEHSRAEAARFSHEAGIAAERARLAGEIHDTLAQGFTSIITLLQAADAELGGSGPDRVRGRLAMAVRTARENLAESRALVAALAPSGLDSSLEQSIRRQVERLGEETAVVADYRRVGEVRALPMPVGVVLLRSVQEALANVRKHSGAGHVTVRLDYAEGGVRLTVRDDGQGFDAGRPTDGYGLGGMRSRAEQVSGTLTVHSGAGSGTTIQLEVPL